MAARILNGFCALACIAAVSVGNAAAGLINPEVSGNTLTAEIELANGTVTADLTLEYEGVSNLSVANLGITVDLVNPLDAGLLARLPSGLVSIPAGFPVLISIEPGASTGFSFDGVASIELYTTNLHYIAGSPLRIFSAHDGGAFKDITQMIAGGSYRTRGGGGNYSEFLIVADTTALATTINGKFDALETLLASYQSHFSATNYAQLAGYISTARSAWIVGNEADAIDGMDDFDDKLSDWAEASAVPNTWAASGGTPNVAGELRALAGTLRFSLTLAANGL